MIKYHTAFSLALAWALRLLWCACTQGNSFYQDRRVEGAWARTTIIMRISYKVYDNDDVAWHGHGHGIGCVNTVPRRILYSTVLPIRIFQSSLFH
jgi:hypothetical protein